MDYDLERDLLIAYNIKKKKREKTRRKSKSNQSGMSIVDPQWETIDPTPNIHSLFQAFDGKFFWNTLGSVEVKWSPRMYSCAGICTYKGRGGCIVSLSLPLLKLRPRKDLVETLLHEMIHAYLFLTRNNKDRDGHGPEFQKHMRRINDESGTQISIYHSFHDEVRLYKTHWWRCDGICRGQKPFYGIVKRSMNRAPGPNDFWYAEHLARCGGTFIKIQEPEGFKSRKSKNASTIDSKQNTLDSFLDKKKKTTNGGSKGVHGFSDLGKDPHQPKITNGVSGPSYNKANGKKDVSKESTIVPFSGSGNVLTLTNSAPDRSKSRLLTLFDQPVKKFKGNNGEPVEIIDLDDIPSTSTNRSLCPSCKNLVDKSILADHINICSRLDSIFGCPKSIWSAMFKPKTSEHNEPIEIVDTDDDETPQLNCPVCNVPVEKNRMNVHLDTCAQLGNIMDNDFEMGDDEIQNKASCPVCNIPVEKSQMNEHLDICAQLDTIMDRSNDVEIQDEIQNKASCPVCNIPVEKSQMNEHLNTCAQLDTIMDRSNDFEIEDEEVHETVCPVCNLKLNPKDLNTHLDECIGVVADSFAQASNESEFDKTQVSCPCCGFKCSMIEINAHIDNCVH